MSPCPLSSSGALPHDHPSSDSLRFSRGQHAPTLLTVCPMEATIIFQTSIVGTMDPFFKVTNQFWILLSLKQVLKPVQAQSFLLYPPNQQSTFSTIQPPWLSWPYLWFWFCDLICPPLVPIAGFILESYLLLYSLFMLFFWLWYITIKSCLNKDLRQLPKIIWGERKTKTKCPPTQLAAFSFLRPGYEQQQQQKMMFG